MPLALLATISLQSIRAAVANADAAVFRLINTGLGARWLDPVMLVITNVGLGLVQAGLNLGIIMFGLVTNREGLRRMGYAGLLAYGASGILSQAAKHIWDRPRPLLVLWDARVVGGPLFANSFPSGHATTAFAAAFAWAAFWPKARYVLYALAFATAVSRVYLGVHFPLDVTYGAVLGALIGIASARLFKPAALENATQKEQAADAVG